MFHIHFYYKHRLFYDEDLESLAKFLPFLKSCKLLWMRINIGLKQNN